MAVITLASIAGLVVSKEAKAILTVIGPMFKSGGGIKNMIGEQAGALAELTAQHMNTDNKKTITRSKWEALQAELGPEIAARVESYLEVMDKEELYNTIMIGWLLMVEEEFDNPNK